MSNKEEMNKLLNMSLCDCTEEEKIMRKRYIEKMTIRKQYIVRKQNKKKKITNLIKNTEQRIKKENIEVKAREYRKLGIQLDKMGRGRRGLEFISLSISYNEELRGHDHPYVYRDRMLYETIRHRNKKNK
jgi:predicted ribonuclease YlaK